MLSRLEMDHMVIVEIWKKKFFKLRRKSEWKGKDKLRGWI